jgi:hypothetical protein
MTVNLVISPFQGQGQSHVLVKVGFQRKPLFLSIYHQINSKLSAKIKFGLPLS